MDSDCNHMEKCSCAAPRVKPEEPCNEQGRRFEAGAWRCSPISMVGESIFLPSRKVSERSFEVERNHHRVMQITTTRAYRHIVEVGSSLLWHPIASEPGRDVEVPNRDPARDSSKSNTRAPNKKFRNKVQRFVGENSRGRRRDQSC